MSGPRCPGCSGEVWCDPRLGLLAHHADCCWLGDEEMEQTADDRAAYGAATTQWSQPDALDGRMFGRVFVRPITTAEVALVVACGADPAAARRASVGVLFLAGGVRRRTLSSITVSALPGMLMTDPRLVR